MDDISVHASISGTVNLDPEHYFTVEDGAHTIQVQTVAFHVDHSDRLDFTGGRGYRVLKDNSLGTQRRNIYSTRRGVPEATQQAVLAEVRQFVAGFGRRDITLYIPPVRKVAR